MKRRNPGKLLYSRPWSRVKLAISLDSKVESGRVYSSKIFTRQETRQVFPVSKIYKERNRTILDICFRVKQSQAVSQKLCDNFRKSNVFAGDSKSLPDRGFTRDTHTAAFMKSCKPGALKRALGPVLLLPKFFNKEIATC